jgi:hypothetical protein
LFLFFSAFLTKKQRIEIDSKKQNDFWNIEKKFLKK